MFILENRRRESFRSVLRNFVRLSPLSSSPVTAVFFTCRRSSNTSASVSKMPWKRREQAHHLIPINKHQKNQRLEWTIWGYTCCQPERRNSIWSGIKINFSKSITVIFRCSVVYLISFMSNRMQTVRDKSVKKKLQ